MYIDMYAIVIVFACSIAVSIKTLYDMHKVEKKTFDRIEKEIRQEMESAQ